MATGSSGSVSQASQPPPTNPKLKRTRPMLPRFLSLAIRKGAARVGDAGDPLANRRVPQCVERDIATVAVRNHEVPRVSLAGTCYRQRISTCAVSTPRRDALRSCCLRRPVEQLQLNRAWVKGLDDGLAQVRPFLRPGRFPGVRAVDKRDDDSLHQGHLAFRCPTSHQRSAPNEGAGDYIETTA